MKATDTVHTTHEEDTQRHVAPPSCRTASQCQGADKEATRGGAQVDDIYYYVDCSAEPRAQSEELCYTTVSFTTAPAESPVAESYSVIQYLPKDESTVYSNV